MRKLFLLVLCTLPFLGIGNAIADSNKPPINGDKFGLGYGNTTTIKSGETVTTQRIDASDKLGATYVDYMDPIIVGEETRNGVAGYNVKTFHTGTVEMMIFPVFE